MLYVEFMIRIAGGTLLLLVAAMIVRDAWHVRTARYGAILAVSLCAVLATSISEASFAPPQLMRYVLSPLSSSTAIFIWWFCLSLFNDDFRLGRVEWTVAAIWTGAGIMNWNDFIHFAPVTNELAPIARTFIAIGIVSHIIYVALRGRRSDLVEERRRARVFISIAIAVLFLTDLLGERVYGYYYTPLGINVVQITAFVAVTVFSVFWLMRLDGSVLAFERPRRAADAADPGDDQLSAKERATYDRLVTAMETEKAYLEPNLSIGALAERVSAPEHQLRALINKSMGHRNFRSYLNGYRMAAAKAALADRAKAQQPILTIAMDSGFASLASFNRAFKLEMGMTPSDYRKAAESGEIPTQN